MPGTKPGSDKPTGRVVVVIVLLMLAGAALRGHLPADDGAPLAAAGGSRAALMFIVAALAATLALIALAIITRLRHPLPVAPSAGELSAMLGGAAGRPNWRVLLLGLGTILAWLLIAILLARLFVPDDVGPAAPIPDSTATPDASSTTPSRPQPPQDNNDDVLGILFASTIGLFLMVVAGSLITSRRQRKSAPARISGDRIESPAPSARSESLARAAEIGLAEMADLRREPREAIIACYVTMERELSHVPGVAPQDFDTPTEVLARAVEHRALHGASAAALVSLFAEARFSPHVMNEEHREVAMRLLRLVLDELSTRTAI